MGRMADMARSGNSSEGSAESARRSGETKLSGPMHAEQKPVSLNKPTKTEGGPASQTDKPLTSRGQVNPVNPSI